VLIIAVGQRMPSWVDQAYLEYAKRLPPDYKLELREIKAQARGNAATDTVLAHEAERIRQALPKRATLIVLDERGTQMTSAGLAQNLVEWRSQGDPIAFVIGSADGVDRELKASARATLRLSDMTLPHGLARVLLAEQLYRAWSIIEKHPYHRV
jgi:23S rRNA (pseudouridine1915-N3)-methyltransferase